MNLNITVKCKNIINLVAAAEFTNKSQRSGMAVRIILNKFAGVVKGSEMVLRYKKIKSLKRIKYLKTNLG